MDLNLQTEKEQEGIRKRPMLSGGLILFGVALFFSTVCTPVGVWARSDISVAESAFSPVWDIFQIVVLYAFYWVAIAFLFILLPERGILRSLPFFVLFAGASVIRCAGSAAVGTSMDGDGITTGVFWENVSNSLLDTFLDLVILTLALLVVFLLLLSKSTAKNAIFEYPPKGFFKPFDRLKAAVLIAVAIPSGAQLLGRIRYDIFYGSPQSWLDLFQMILFYLSDLLFCFLGDLFVLFLLRLFKPETEDSTHVRSSLSDRPF